MRYRVLISSSQNSWCSSLALAFEEQSDYVVVGTVVLDGLIEKAAEVYPDVVVIKYDEHNPADLVAAMSEKCPFSLPIVLVNDPQDVDIMAVLHAGARGCLPCRLLPPQIVEVVTLIVEAGIVCLPRLNPQHYDGRNAAPGVLSALTGRERQVVALLGCNCSNLEIAERLCLSESTVKTHLRNIFRKLEVRNRHEALSLILAGYSPFQFLEAIQNQSELEPC